MPHARFSISADAVARLGADFTKALNPHATPTLVTAGPDNQLSVAMAAGPAWLELSQAAEVVSPGAFALHGLLTPSARHLDGTLSYRVHDDRLTMKSEDGAVVAESVLPPHSADHVSGPFHELGTVAATLLHSVLGALPTALSSFVQFFDGGAFVAKHPEYCCIRSQELTASWTLPASLVRLVETLLKGRDDQWVRVLGDEQRTALSLDGAILHWPTTETAKSPPLWQPHGWQITSKQAKHLARVAGADINGSIRLRAVDGELIAEASTQEGRIKETLKLPCSVESRTSLISPCRQVANALKLFKEQRIELGVVDGLLIVREEREVFEFAYALAARHHGG